MARQPAPRIDPRDPALRPVKDFLEWLYKTVPGIPETVDSLSATVAQFVTEVTAALATLATAIATVAGDLADLEVSTEDRLGCVYNFMHPGQDGSATTRRMWPSYLTTPWAASIGKRNRVFIPYDGQLRKLLTQNPSPFPSTGNVVTYVVIRSVDGGTTWSDTALTTSSAASDETVLTSSATVSVSAGDFIMVEVRFAGAVTANGTDDSMVASVWYTTDAP